MQKSFTLASLPPSEAPPHVLYDLSGRWQSASEKRVHGSDPQQKAKKSDEHLLLKQPLPAGQSQAELHDVLPSDEASTPLPAEPPEPVLPAEPPVPDPALPAVPPPVVEVPALPAVVVAAPPEPPFPPPVVVVAAPEPAEPVLVVPLLSSLVHPKSTAARQVPITTTCRERIRSPLGLLVCRPLISESFENDRPRDVSVGSRLERGAHFLSALRGGREGHPRRLIGRRDRRRADHPGAGRPDAKLVGVVGDDLARAAQRLAACVPVLLLDVVDALRDVAVGADDHRVGADGAEGDDADSVGGIAKLSVPMNGATNLFAQEIEAHVLLGGREPQLGHRIVLRHHGGGIEVEETDDVAAHVFARVAEEPDARVLAVEEVGRSHVQAAVVRDGRFKISMFGPAIAAKSSAAVYMKPVSATIRSWSATGRADCGRTCGSGSFQNTRPLKK